MSNYFFPGADIQFSCFLFFLRCLAFFFFDASRCMVAIAGLKTEAALLAELQCRHPSLTTGPGSSIPPHDAAWEWPLPEPCCGLSGVVECTRPGSGLSLFLCWQCASFTGPGAGCRLGFGHCSLLNLRNVITPASSDYEFDKVIGFLANSLQLCNEVIVYP